MDNPQIFERCVFRLVALGALVSAFSCHSAQAQAPGPTSEVGPRVGEPVTATKPIRGMIGVGTWSTQAEFKDIKVTKGNQTLFASDFSQGLQGWRRGRGQWQVVDGVLRQTSDEEDARLVIGTPTWSDYTLTLKARKTGGKEGFLILFGLPDQNSRNWWNLGGWANTRSGIEGQGVQANEVPRQIENGQTTTYRFVSKDRPVFFNGDGPRREYLYSIPGGRNADAVLNITWGEDVAPRVGGRYVIVNRQSGKVLEVAGANKNNGAGIQQSDYKRAANQQWDVAPLIAPVGDQSYFTVRALHSGKSLDTAEWNHDEGGKIQQWGEGDAGAQHWYFDYAGDGYFYIRSRHSTECLGVAGASKSNGAIVQQFSHKNAPSLQWRLVPVSGLNQSALDSVAPRSPTGLKAVAKAPAVELQWAPSRDADVVSYTVLRSTTANGPYDTIARGVTGRTFTDKEASGGLPYFYKVKAVDRSFNQSAFSMPARLTSGNAVLP